MPPIVDRGYFESCIPSTWDVLQTTSDTEFRFDHRSDTPVPGISDIHVPGAFDTSVLSSFSNILISGNSNNGRKVQHVQHSSYMPDYPESHINGFAHVISVQNMSSRHASMLWQDIQYSKNKQGTQCSTSIPFLGFTADKQPIPGFCTTIKCTGVRYCEYAAPEIQSWDHIKVHPKDFQRLEEVVSIQRDVPKSQWRQFQTESHFYAVSKYFKKSQACSARTSESACKLTWFEEDEIDPLLNQYPCYLQCALWSSESPTLHYRQSLQHNANYYSSYLRHLILNNAAIYEKSSQCSIVTSQRVRRQTCGRTHHQGPGKLLSKSCDVKFHFYIPTNLDQSPYVILVSTGIHTHPPPPPVKPPSEIMRGLVAVIQQMNTLNLTGKSFLHSSQLQQFLRQHNGRSLTEIHASFNNIDIVQSLIRKQQLLDYPDGRYFQGVIHEYEQECLKSGSEQYIQNIWCDGSHLMITLFYHTQAEAFTKLQTFQMDLSFKRCSGVIKEFSIVQYSDIRQQTEVYCRVLVNFDTREGYRRIFTSLFTELERVSGRTVQWKHIHNTGIEAITVDMCAKQALGLGDYLHDKYPRLSPEEHIQYVLVFCKVHFLRGIQRSFQNEDLKYLLRQIPELPNAQDCRHFLQSLKEKYPESTGWINNKSTPWILSGLNVHCFKGDSDSWYLASRDTNAAESSHHQDNILGTGLSTLGAVINARKHDHLIWTTGKIAEITGVQRQYRLHSMTERIEQSLTRKEQRRQQYRKKIQEKQDIFAIGETTSRSTLVEPGDQLSQELLSAVSVTHIPPQQFSSSGAQRSTKGTNQKKRKQRLSTDKATSEITENQSQSTFNLEEEKERNRLQQERQEKELEYLEKKMQIMERLKALQEE